MGRLMSRPLLLFAVLFPFWLRADVIIPGTHPVGVCVKMTNLEEFPIVVALVVSGPGGGTPLTGELFKPDSCKGSIYWACITKLFWADKTYYDSAGMSGVVGSDAVTGAFSGPKLAKVSAAAQPVHLLCDSIAFFHPAVPDSNLLQTEDRFYTIIKSGSSYRLYLSERVSHMSNNTDVTETFGPPPLGVIIMRPGQAVVNKVFQISWRNGFLDIASRAAIKADGGIVDGKGRYVVRLTHSFAQGEHLRSSLNLLSPGVYCLRLSTSSGRIAQTFGVINAGAAGR